MKNWLNGLINTWNYKKAKVSSQINLIKNYWSYYFNFFNLKHKIKISLVKNKESSNLQTKLEIKNIMTNSTKNYFKQPIQKDIIYNNLETKNKTFDLKSEEKAWVDKKIVNTKEKSYEINFKKIDKDKTNHDSQINENFGFRYNYNF